MHYCSPQEFILSVHMYHRLQFEVPFLLLHSPGVLGVVPVSMSIPSLCLGMLEVSGNIARCKSISPGTARVNDTILASLDLIFNLRTGATDRPALNINHGNDSLQNHGVGPRLGCLLLWPSHIFLPGNSIAMLCLESSKTLACDPLPQAPKNKSLKPCPITKNIKKPVSFSSLLFCFLEQLRSSLMSLKGEGIHQNRRLSKMCNTIHLTSHNKQWLVDHRQTQGFQACFTVQS